MLRDLNVLALVKDAERYIFLYPDGSEDQILRQFHALAADPEVSLTWYDAAVLRQRLARLREERQTGRYDVLTLPE